MESIAAGVAVALVMGCTPSDEAPPPATTEDSMAESSSDTASSDSTLPETTIEDTEMADTLVIDALDSTTPDTMVSDSAMDTAKPDTAMADTAMTDTTMTDTAMPDTAVADTAMDVVSDGSVSCGSAPYQIYDPVSVYNPTGMPMTDLTLTLSICPGSSILIPYMKTRTFSVQQKTPFYSIATQPGSVPLLSAEANIQFAGIPKIALAVTMLPSNWPTIKNPAWDATKNAAIEVAVNASTGTGACSMKNGVTYTVVGHPEAVIAYDGGGTSTGTGGNVGAWITIVTTGTATAPEYVTLTQTKAGCTVGPSALDKLFATGRAPVAIGYRTGVMTGEVTN